MIYGLAEGDMKKIQGVFSLFDDLDKVIVFGSRAKGNFKPASDVDITLIGENLNLDIQNKIAWKLDDLLLPYTFDISIFKNISNKELIAHIERVGKVLYKKSLL